MRLCKDCTFVEIARNMMGGVMDTDNWRCLWGVKPVKNVISGEQYLPPGLPLCRDTRGQKGHCGPYAQNYKRQWWKIWRTR